jgi:hypothetical protein
MMRPFTLAGLLLFATFVPAQAQAVDAVVCVNRFYLALLETM